MSPRSLVVVRGSYRGTDPTFACMAHDVQPKRYVMLEMEDGRVMDRHIVADRRVVEARMQDASYRGVYVDMRTDSNLLPLTAPTRAEEADLATYRRAKSNEELESLASLGAATVRMLHQDDSSSSFRGAAQTTGLKSAFHVHKARGFTQYRGGLQDALGRCSDLTRVDAKTPEWQDRLDRAYRGFADVAAHLASGVSVDDLNRRFLSHMDPDRDYVYGNVVHHTGFESHETSLPLTTVEKYDFLTVGAALGDGRETALIYRSAAPIQERTYGSETGFSNLGRDAQSERINSIAKEIREKYMQLETGDEQGADLTFQNYDEETTLDTMLNHANRNEQFRFMLLPEHLIKVPRLHKQPKLLETLLRMMLSVVEARLVAKELGECTEHTEAYEAVILRLQEESDLLSRTNEKQFQDIFELVKEKEEGELLREGLQQDIEKMSSIFKLEFDTIHLESENKLLLQAALHQKDVANYERELRDAGQRDDEDRGPATEYDFTP